MNRALNMLVLCILVLAPAARAQFTTPAEATEYRFTPDYEQTIEYLRALERESQWLKLQPFGVTPLGRPMISVIVSRDQAFTPEELKRQDRVRVLIQNGIHSGEIDGKDACLELIRDVAVTRTRAELLDGAALIIVPVFNIDGHEMSSPYNRINQNGPEEMGFRATSQNYNLNRDYLKLDTPEMQALVALWNEWDPHFFIDNHVTDGADFQYAVSYTITRHDNGPPAIRDWGRQLFVPFVTARMAALGEPIVPYVITMGRPLHEGIIDFVESPRYSTGYAAARNRPGLLVEMHMLKDYGRRVRANYKMMVAVLELLNQEGPSLKAAASRADSLDRAGRHGAIPLRFTRADDPDTLSFLGYAYETRTSEISGGEWIVYDTTRPETMRLPYFNKTIPTVSVDVPAAYLIPPQWTEVIGRLRQHGVSMNRLTEPVELEIEQYLFDSVSWRAQSYEGHHLVEQVTLGRTRTVAYPAGTVVVPTAQPGVRLIMHALEPDGPDSFFKWGFFDTILEQKEYAERYAAEQLGRDMLAGDSVVAAEFADRVRNDSAFASSPSQRWDFFYKRSPWAEPMLRVYPVGRLTAPLALPLGDF